MQDSNDHNTTDDLERKRDDAKTRSNHELKQWEEDIKFLMSDKRGRRIVHGLLRRARIYQQTFNASSPTATAFNEGRRSMGLEILADINIVPENYIRMLRENKG